MVTQIYLHEEPLDDSELKPDILLKHAYELQMLEKLNRNLLATYKDLLSFVYNDNASNLEVPLGKIIEFTQAVKSGGLGPDKELNKKIEDFLRYDVRARLDSIREFTSRVMNSLGSLSL